MRHKTFGIGAALLVFALAGTAWATGAVSSIVAADGSINGCYKQQNGQLRVVPSGEACEPSELALSWAQKGPAGETGARGEQGPVGPQGERGPQGEVGPRGETGARGEQGSVGPQGSRGERGEKGETGAAGPQGPRGESGPAGTDGISVTATPVGSGNANCPQGGSRFDAGSTTTFACNGVDGAAGGSPALAGVQVVTSTEYWGQQCSGGGYLIGPTCTPWGSQTATALCPSGKTAIGGGFEDQVGPRVSRPVADGAGWVVIAVPTAAGRITAYAICANA